MLRLARPWAGAGLGAEAVFGPGDCLLSEVAPSDRAGEHVVVMRGEARGEPRLLVQHPYPRRDAAHAPERRGFLPRPRKGKEAEAAPEALGALARMNEVTARVQELGEALDDPTALWPRLRAAWDRAEQEEDPRMAEIVRQARELTPVLKAFREHIRRVLRRHRELTPLDRVQEMDRAAMRWLSRQPGRTTAERAGADQRILAVVRHQNFDTLENRVAHAYVRLAADAGREWLREHPRATGSKRFQTVQAYLKLCKAVAAELADLSVAIASVDVTPNYVLLEDRTYRLIREAWEALLRREKALDELWAWQAQTWTDFSVLAIVLALHDVEGAELIAQSPIRFLSEAVNGLWFEQERPIAVFWLHRQGRVVEVMARPERPGTLLTYARAHVALRISDPLDRSAFPHRVAVWTPHAMARLDLREAADQAGLRLAELARVAVVAHVPATRDKLMISDKLYRLRVIPQQNPAFLALAMGSTSVQREITKTISGMAESQTNISQSTLKPLPVQRPSRPEQDAIVQALQAQAKKLETEERLLDKLRLQKSGLMDDLLTGRVPVTPLL